MSPSDPCWVITDQAAGNQRQALALAELLRLPFRHLVLTSRAPWSWLAPRLTLAGRSSLPADQQRLFSPPWPRMAIGCGRSAALFTRMLKRLAGDGCYTVQILDPRMDPKHWDTVIAPRHDGLRGDNVLRLIGSLNTIDASWLEDGRETCPMLSDLPNPRVGLLLGGPRKGIALDDGYARQLIGALRHKHQRQGGSLMVLASRRTPVTLVQTIRQQLAGIPGLVWDGKDDRPNPYQGVLGWADQLVVTPDSVNMLSEACATGHPVATLVTTPLPAKIAGFHQTLREAGLLRDLEDPIIAARKPLRESFAIAAEVRQRFLIRQGYPPLDTRRDKI